MSKEEAIKVVKIQTCVLKVNIHCDGCKQKVKKLLQKIEGVYSTSIDAEQGKVTVSGNVDADTLIKKLRKKGKHAELWSSKGGNAQLNKQFHAIQLENAKGSKDGKPQKGGKDQNGQQQQQQLQQLQQMKGLKDLNLPQLKDLKLPNKDQKSVKLSLPEDDGIGSDDEYDDDYDDDDDGDGDEDMYDDGFDDDLDIDPDEVKAQLKMKAMNQQLPPMGAPAMNNDKKGSGGGNGKKGGGGADVHVQNKAMVGSGDSKNGNGGKKGGGNCGGGQNQGGAGGAAKNGGKNGGPHDPKNGGNGGSGSNKVATNGSNGGNNNVSGGGKNGGGGNKNDLSHPMFNNVGHGFHEMGLGGAANVGQMGNMPVGQMGNIPAVQGLPAAPPGMNVGGYFQGAGPEFLAGNPYHQQYAAAMMMQQRQNGMYARPPYPLAYMPQPPPQASESYADMFSDENPNSCAVM